MKDEDAFFKTNIKDTPLQAYKSQVFANKETEVAAESHRIGGRGRREMIENFKFIQIERRAYKVFLMQSASLSRLLKMAESKGDSHYG